MEFPQVFATQGVCYTRPVDSPLHQTSFLAAEVVRTLAPDTNAKLFERIFARVHGYFHKVLRDADAAEECFQETFTRLQESLTTAKYDPDRSFNAWVWLKARTVYVDYCRQRGRGMDALPEVVPSPHETSQLGRRLDAQTMLSRIEERLGHETCETFVLYYVGSLTQDEVAELVGCDPRTVRRRLKAAHEVIDETLDA